MSRDSYFKKRKQEKADFSHTGTREFKEAKIVLIDKKINTLAVTKIDSTRTD